MNDMSIYQGEERRIQNTKDHDTLVTLVEMTANMKESFDKHVIEDSKRIDKLGEKIWQHQRLLYILIGGATILELLMPYLLKH